MTRGYQGANGSYFTTVTNHRLGKLEEFTQGSSALTVTKTQWVSTVGGAANVEGDADFHSLRTLASSSDVREYEAAAFFNLYKVIDRMAQLPEGSDQAIDEDTRAEAERVLGYLDLYEIPAPQVFSHGGDAVVFTWEGHIVCRYATVSGSELGVLDVHQKSKTECSYPQLSLQSAEMDSFLDKFRASRLSHHVRK